MNAKITKRQYALIIFFVPFVFKFSVLPAMLSERAGRDVWLTIFLIMLTEGAQLLFIILVDKKGGLDAIRERYGDTVYFLITLPILLVLVLKASVYTAETTSYANSYLFYNITTKGVGIVVILASSYLAIKGAKGIGRLVELAVWLIPVAIIIGALFGKLKLSPSYVLPIGANGLTPIALSYNDALFWALDFSPLLFFKTQEDTLLRKEKRAKIPTIPIAITLSILFMTLLYLFYVMNYGEAGHLVDTAFSSLGAFNVVNTEIGSIDWPAITLWLTVAIISLALKIFGSGAVLHSLRLPFPISCLIVGVIVITLSQLLFYNLERAFSLATSFVKYIVFGLEISMPMVAFTLLDIKERKGGEKLEATI
jgi:hypothetical protein